MPLVLPLVVLDLLSHRKMGHGILSNQCFSEEAFELASQLSADRAPDKQQAGDAQTENTGRWSASRQLQIYKCHMPQSVTDGHSMLSPLLFF